MRVLAIGSEGNIGAPLVTYLRAQGHELFEVDIEPGWRPAYRVADINHPLDLLEAFDWGPDVVYLMAAVVSRVTCEQASGLAVTTNLAGVNNVVQLTKRIGARLVFFSTSEVYGPTDGVMDEACPPHPNNRYGLTKWLGEQLIEYEARHGLMASIVRPFMIYSEDEDLGDHRSFMIRCAQSLATGRAVDVHAGSVRGWMHVDDAVVALERMAHLRQYAVVNIGHPDLVSTEDLAEMIRERLGAPRFLLRTVDQPERMTLIKRPALARQAELLGVTPRISLDEGVERVCARFARVVA